LDDQGSCWTIILERLQLGYDLDITSTCDYRGTNTGDDSMIGHSGVTLP